MYVWAEFRRDVGSMTEDGKKKKKTVLKRKRRQLLLIYILKVPGSRAVFLSHKAA